MSDLSTILIAFIGFCGSLAAGFFKLLADTNKVHAKVATAVDNLSKSTDKQTNAMNEVASNTERSALAQERAADESKERNGHLAELSIQQAEKIIAHINDVKEQHVQKQVVDEQEVKVETVGKVTRAKQ